tara:strand:+ start:426 stop:1178 length:753 start_codon:yes stop_codon:yes gene_type:complete
MPVIIDLNWPAPANIRAFVTCRKGGSSAFPYDSLNLADHVGDDVQSVIANRSQLQNTIGGTVTIHWLNQVHGVDVVEAGYNSNIIQADAQMTARQGAALAVLTADCLPVLFCDISGTKIAAAHAGWRGLAGGILDNTLTAMDVEPSQVLAWLGPAISARHFEVGAEVRLAFLDAVDSNRFNATNQCFKAVKNNPEQYMADLYALAKERLKYLGVTKVYGGDFCTWEQSDRFYSYRRDGVTGRMASIICLV